jgi:hypothetical protein
MKFEINIPNPAPLFNMRSFGLALVIATMWILFYGVVLGLMWFGLTARVESDRCVSVYNQYIAEIQTYYYPNSTIPIIRNYDPLQWNTSSITNNSTNTLARVSISRSQVLGAPAGTYNYQENMVLINKS